MRNAIPVSLVNPAEARMISGQSAKYIEAALAAYKKGERNHPTMKVIAEGLTDQQIADLAAYYSARGSEPATTASK